MKLSGIVGKGLSLRLVNMAGMAVVAAALMLTATYVRHELSYDRHNRNALRTVRLSLSEKDRNMDVRIWGNGIYQLLAGCPQVEAVAKMRRADLPSVTVGGKMLFVPSGALEVNREFFRVFDVVSGGKVLPEPGPDAPVAYISEGYARFVAAQTGVAPEDVKVLENRDGGMSVPVGGIFRDLPETSHFHADILLCNPRAFEMPKFTYVYLLLKEGTDCQELARRITSLVREADENARDMEAFVMPLTDIHLHSRFDRELEGNGSMTYIFMLVCANLLLLVVAMSDLVLNQRVIFAGNWRSWMIRRMLGADVLRLAARELAVSAAVAAAAVCIAAAVLEAAGSAFGVFWDMPVSLIAVTGAAFVLISSVVAVVPVLRTGMAGRTGRISGGAKRILTLQYAVSIFILVLAVGMARQMRLVSRIQPGGDGSSVLVMELPDFASASKYAVFREELLKRPFITGVTSVMQVPGEAVIDGALFRRFGSDDEGVRLPIMVAGEGFLEFFGIDVAAGEGFRPLAMDYGQETELLRSRLMYGEISPLEEQYVINRSAAAALGFVNPEDALGASLEMNQGTVDYIGRGTVAGVTEDFGYTGAFSQAGPLVVLQRNLFAKKILVAMDGDNVQEALAAVRGVWEEIFPENGFDGGYSFLSDDFRDTYSNEIYAARMMLVFVSLCLTITVLGLVIFIAHIVQRRKKEIAVRKVQGASVRDILLMINLYYLKYVAVAFAVAAPAAWYVLWRWLERFAYRAEPCWWMFAGAAAAVVLVSVAAVSVQSRRAACANPLDGIREV